MDLLAQTTGVGIAEVLIQAAAQAPALVVLCVVVWVFLRHIKESQQYQAEREKAFSAAQAERERQWDERQKARDIHLEKLGDTCHTFQQAFAADSKAFHRDLQETTAEALTENSHVIKEALSVMGGIKHELARLVK